MLAKTIWTCVYVLKTGESRDLAFLPHKYEALKPRVSDGMAELVLQVPTFTQLGIEGVR